MLVKMFEDILRYWLSGGVYQKKKTGGTGYRETFIEKKESWGRVRCPRY